MKHTNKYMKLDGILYFCFKLKKTCWGQLGISEHGLWIVYDTEKSLIIF